VPIRLERFPFGPEQCRFGSERCPFNPERLPFDSEKCRFDPETFAADGERGLTEKRKDGKLQENGAGPVDR
jgi:hypothetical protein